MSEYHEPLKYVRLLDSDCLLMKKVNKRHKNCCDCSLLRTCVIISSNKTLNVEGC